MTVSRFAPVAPVAVHMRLLEAGVLGDYHLLLAHQVLRQPDAYQAFYKHLLPQKLGHKPQIIMDNSLIELGAPLPMKYVVEAAEIVNASIVVLPDMLTERIETLNAASKGVEELHELKATSPYAQRVKTLGVAQGKSTTDIFSCARDMIQLLGVDIISIPRVVVKTTGTRTKLVQMVREYGRPVHLLGFSDNLLDDFTTVGLPGVMGIDSAVPIWYGLQGFEFPKNPPMNADFGRRPADYEMQSEINSRVLWNINRVDEWVNIATSARTRK